MRAAVVVAVLAVAGCDSVFSVDHVRGIDAPDAATDVCLQDSFDAPLDTTVWSLAGEGNGLVIYDDSGLLHVDVPALVSSTQNLFGGVHTGSRNLTAASTEIEVAQVADYSQPSTVGLLLAFDGANQYRLVVTRGQVLAIKILAKVTTEVRTAPYDPAKHRFLRIRHDADADQMVFETRGATTDYEIFVTAPREIDLSTIDTWLYAQSFNDKAAAFSGQFDSMLMTGPSCH